MTFLKPAELKQLWAESAPKYMSFTEHVRQPGYYFRQLGIPTAWAGICEMAYIGLTPGKAMTISMSEWTGNSWYDKPDGWTDETVLHGTSLAAAVPIIWEGLRPSIGTWRGPQCEAISKKHGQLPAVYATPRWDGTQAYMGHATEESSKRNEEFSYHSQLADGPQVRVVIECWAARRMAKIPRTKKSKEQLLYHPKDIHVKALHFVCGRAAEGEQVDKVYHEMMGPHGKTRRNTKNKLEHAEKLVKGTHHVFGKPPKIDPGAAQNYLSQWYQAHHDPELPSERLQREHPRELPKPQRKNKRRKKSKANQDCPGGGEQEAHPHWQ